MNRTSPTLVAALAAAALVASTPGVARADAALIDQAQTAIDDIDYPAARTLLARALADGGLDRDDLARAHHLAGTVAAVLDDKDGARDHFVAWLLLEPGADLDDGVSPKIAAPFDAARARAAKLGAMRFTITVRRDGNAARIENDARDPLHLATRLAVSIDGSAPERLPVAGGSIRIGDGRVAVAVEVVDARGNTLATERATLENVAMTADPPAAAEVATPRRTSGRYPALLRWPTWTVLAVGAAGAGGYFTWKVGQDEDALTAINAAPGDHSFDDADAARDRGERHALYANVAFGAATALAAAAVLTLVLEPADGVEVTPTASADGAGVDARIRF